MKICLFADIHGNGPAFFNALGPILKEQAALNVFLGDLCGYYYNQVEILNAFGTIPNLISVKGNHDEMFLKIAAGDLEIRREYVTRYGHSMENLLRENSSEMQVWLEQLDFSYFDEGNGFVCLHGSPLDPMNDYVYPDSSLECFGDMAARFVFLGHTHYRMHRLHGEVHFINPGSLGQPRDGGLPSYAVVDTDACEVKFREVDFDKVRLRDRIRRMGDEGLYLETVLSR